MQGPAHFMFFFPTQTVIIVTSAEKKINTKVQQTICLLQPFTDSSSTRLESKNGLPQSWEIINYYLTCENWIPAKHNHNNITNVQEF